MRHPTPGQGTAWRIDRGGAGAAWSESRDAGFMMSYLLDGVPIDSIDLKAMVVSRGIRVGQRIYKEFARTNRVFANPLKCNCMILPDGTIVQMTDLQLHLGYLKNALSWDRIRQIKYFSHMQTPFRLDLNEDRQAVLYYRNEAVTPVSFPPYTDFYDRKTSSGLPFLGNAVIQGTRWLAFQCLWPCDYACAGKPCEFCYFGGVFQSLAKRGKPLPAIPSPQDVADIVESAFWHSGCDSMQITGGSSFDSARECRLIKGYLRAIRDRIGSWPGRGEILLYVTPPENPAELDEFFALGASRIACSLEVWNDRLARQITPGKWHFTGRQRHLDALQYIAEKYGPGKAFSNFIIGLEPFESFAEGAEYLASRGIIPTASVWIPFGRPVLGSMKPPDLAYYQNVKRLLASLYRQYGLEPAGANGINVCIERDIWLGCVSPGRG